MKLRNKAKKNRYVTFSNGILKSEAEIEVNKIEAKEIMALTYLTKF